MRCAICDSDSDTVTITDDCSECQQAISDCLAGYPSLEDGMEIVDPEYDFDGAFGP